MKHSNLKLNCNEVFNIAIYVHVYDKVYQQIKYLHLWMGENVYSRIQWNFVIVHCKVHHEQFVTKRFTGCDDSLPMLWT
jgi:hypothetical protein